MIGVAAINKLGYVGLNNSLPWKCSADLKFFKKLTTGGTVIMGRKTWESLPKKPLPNRQNLVFTANCLRDTTNLPLEKSPAALNDLDHESPIFVLGGAQTWETFKNEIDTFFISRINDETVGDIKFPIDLETMYKKMVTEDKGDFVLEIWVKKGTHEKVS